jgi:hypothetical protein
MRSLHRRSAVSTLLVLAASSAVALAPLSASAQAVTTPEQFFGHDIGADYELPNYTQFEAYWRLLAEESSRMVVEEIGRTAEGRPQIMAIVTSPQNHANLERYHQISSRLAWAEGVGEGEARALAEEGKAVV